MQSRAGEPKRPGRSVVRSGRASPGHTAGTRRGSPDGARHAVRVRGGGVLWSGGAVPRWCAWVVGVADVSSDVLRACEFIDRIDGARRNGVCTNCC